MPGFMEILDKIDILILRELQKDAKLTTKELAAKVNLSPSPVFERQKRLEREGYIKKYVAVVDPIKTGNGIMRLHCHTAGVWPHTYLGVQFHARHGRLRVWPYMGIGLPFMAQTTLCPHRITCRVGCTCVCSMAHINVF